MSKNERGTKRLCGECSNKFYDLGRDPIVCPVCETVFVVEEPAPKARAARAPKPEKPKAAEETPATETAPAAEAVEPTEAAAAAAASGPKIVSLDEAEAEEAGDQPEVDDEALAALGGDDEDIPDADDDDVFLETDDEEGSDVTDIVPGPAKAGEES